MNSAPSSTPRRWTVAPRTCNDEVADLDVSEAGGWHPHHSAQHVFANGNSAQDNPATLSISDLLTNDNWAQLSDESPLFPPEVDGLSPGDQLTVNWGLQPGDGEETRIVDLVFEHEDWWTLHAWLYFEDTEGLFAPVNHNPDGDPLQAPPHH